VFSGRDDITDDENTGKEKFRGVRLALGSCGSHSRVQRETREPQSQHELRLAVDLTTLNGLCDRDVMTRNV
jgi:hypothetical protein